mgnify:CR=1 FL=1
MSLYDIITSFESIGVFDVAMPFILVFTLVFGVLEKISLFGANKKNINMVVSLVLAFLAIRNVFFIEMLNRFLPNIAMFLIIILMFLLLLGTFGGTLTGFQNMAAILAFIIAAIFVILALSSDVLLGYGFVMPLFLTEFLSDYQTKATILFIGGLVIVIYMTTSESQTSWWDKLEKLGNDFGIGKLGK